MNTELAWETVRVYLDDYIPVGDGHYEATEALTFLRSEMERLEGERDHAQGVAETFGNKARELQEALREYTKLANAKNPDIARSVLDRAALPDTEGRPKPRGGIAHGPGNVAQLSVEHEPWPDTEGPE